MKALLKSSFIVAIATFCSYTLVAQAERSRDYSESWNNINNVVVIHRHGPLEIIPYSGNEVKLVAHISVLAKEANDAQIFIDHFEIKPNVFSGRLEIVTKFNTKSWTTNNNNTKIRFSDGTKASGIKKIEIEYQLHVPALKSLELSNKYNNIEVTKDFNGDLIVKQYDATIKARKVSGKLTLNLKYSKAYIAEVGDLDIDIYDSKVEVAKAQNVIVRSKYSKIDLGAIKSASFNSYDGYYNIVSVADGLHIVDKYSGYEIGSAGAVDVSMHDGKFQVDKATRITGRSKYSTYDINEVDTLDINTTYDDNFNITSLKSFSCNDSKYSSFEIESLADKAIFLSSYGDEFVVTNVGQSFSQFQIECKYTHVKLPLSTLPGYQITANMKYGKLSYDEPSENIKHKERNAELELQAQVGVKNSKAEVTIKAYDSNIRLK